MLRNSYFATYEVSATGISVCPTRTCPGGSAELVARSRRPSFFNYRAFILVVDVVAELKVVGYPVSITAAAAV